MSHIIRLIRSAIEKFKLSEERSKFRWRFAYLALKHKEGK
jgi:hypothetical protein